MDILVWHLFLESLEWFYQWHFFFLWVLLEADVQTHQILGVPREKASPNIFIKVPGVYLEGVTVLLWPMGPLYLSGSGTLELL